MKGLVMDEHLVGWNLEMSSQQFEPSPFPLDFGLWILDLGLGLGT